jgi:conjugal transfer pilus assembly protein TraF
MSRVFVVLLVCLTMSGSLWASEEEKTGFLWYGEAEEEEVIKAEEIKPVQMLLGNQEQDPTLTKQQVQAYFESKLDKAVFYPTKDNVKNFIELQNKGMEQADLFTDTWKAVLRENPQLDEELKHPSSQFALNIAKDAHWENVQQAIKEIKQDYGLIYFFVDGYWSQAMAKIVSSVARRHGIEVLAVSIDGSALLSSFSFSETVLDNGISDRMKVPHFPALYAVNHKEQTWFPIAFGVRAESDIEESIYAIKRFKLIEGQTPPLQTIEVRS